MTDAAIKTDLNTAIGIAFSNVFREHPAEEDNTSTKGLVAVKEEQDISIKKVLFD